MKWYNNFSLCFHLNQEACDLSLAVLKYLNPTIVSLPVLPNNIKELSLDSATRSISLGNKLGTHLLVSCITGSPSLTMSADSTNLLYLLELSSQAMLVPKYIGGTTLL